MNHTEATERAIEAEAALALQTEALRKAYEILDAPEPGSPDAPKTVTELRELACLRLDQAKTFIFDAIALTASGGSIATE